MLDQLRQIAIFAKTVDHGSFRAAARALDLSPSVVSHHIAQLEERLGTALLYRSTRKLSVTQDGERLLAHAHVMIAAADAGLHGVSDFGDQLSGVLNVTLPAVLAQSGISERIADFSRKNPKVQLQLDFSDTRREVIAAGIDVAVRMGWLKDSSLRARKLQDVDRMLVASAAYIESRVAPDNPRDLNDWDWLELTPVRLRPQFRNGDRTVQLRPSPNLSVNDAHAMYSLAKAGAGLAMLPAFLVEADIRSNAMVHVLPEWRLEPIGVYAVWPPNAPKKGLTTSFVRHLAGEVS